MRIWNAHGLNPKLVKWTLLDDIFNAVTIEYTIDTDEILRNSQTNGKDFKNGMEWEARSLDDLGRVSMVKLVSSNWNLVGL